MDMIRVKSVSAGLDRNDNTVLRGKLPLIPDKHHDMTYEEEKVQVHAVLI
jgi:hypothetical protein